MWNHFLSFEDIKRTIVFQFEDVDAGFSYRLIGIPGPLDAATLRRSGALADYVDP